MGGWAGGESVGGSVGGSVVGRSLTPLTPFVHSFFHYPGLFLASHKGAAPKDPSCRRVSLKHGSHSSQFHVMPRFRAQVHLYTIVDQYHVPRSYEHQRE